MDVRRRLAYVGLLLLLLPLFAASQTADELQNRITDRKSAIEALEKEIAQYQKELEAVSREKQTLESAIRTLDLSIKKVSTDIRLTENKIAAKDQEIKALGLSIKDTEETIGDHRSAIAENLRAISQAERDSLVMTVLAYDNLSDFFDDLATRRQFQSSVEDRVDNLTIAKVNLEDKKEVSEQKRRELATLKANLTDQRRGLDVAKSEKNKLLVSTKSTEANYQKVLQQKISEHQNFERELLEYESQLKLIVDPSSLPKTGSGVLSWPVDNVFITQYFGNTDFATKNAQIYNGKGHNAIDLRASIGTPIKAALSGVVEATGDTDLTCPNASYGRWVLIKHNNGLSTLYAHLSYIRVTQGQQVSTRETIGYAGNTGYATGPHLHFGVFATQGTKVTTFPSSSCKGRLYTLPLVDSKGYLNPLSYL